jgi:hypothetical protein
MKSSKEFFSKSIYWQNHETNKRYFFAYVDDVLLLLRLNDFPDEPLLTFIHGLEIIDIDEAPANWILPF